MSEGKKWSVRKTKRIGIRTFWEVYKVDDRGETVLRGWWPSEKEARDLAERLNNCAERTGGWYEADL